MNAALKAKPGPLVNCSRSGVLPKSDTQILPTDPWEAYYGVKRGDNLRNLEPDRPTKTGLRIRVANDLRSRERAFRLGYKAYRERGFLEAKADKRYIEAYDADQHTTVFLLEDENEIALATLSLILDGPGGLPCDAVFPLQRSENRRMAEPARFAIASRGRHNNVYNKLMMNILLLYGRRVMGVQEFVIEVNPRHAPFYRRHLLYEQISPVRSCARMKDAPAVLMKLDAALQERAIKEVAGQGSEAKGRFAKTVYRHFLPYAQEKTWADCLARQHRAMTRDEAEYFGLMQTVTCSSE